MILNTYLKTNKSRINQLINGINYKFTGDLSFYSNDNLSYKSWLTIYEDLSKAS